MARGAYPVHFYDFFVRLYQVFHELIMRLHQGFYEFVGRVYQVEWGAYPAHRLWRPGTSRTGNTSRATRDPTYRPVRGRGLRV